MKSHGSADRLAFRCALERAHDEAAAGVLGRISELVAARSTLAARVPPKAANA